MDTRLTLIGMRYFCSLKLVSTVRFLPLVPGIAMLCTLTACGSNVDLVADETADLQRDSLSHVYYYANPYPADPDAVEIRRAIARVNNANEWERQLLTELV